MFSYACRATIRSMNLADRYVSTDSSEGEKCRIGSSIGAMMIQRRKLQHAADGPSAVLIR